MSKPCTVLAVLAISLSAVDAGTAIAQQIPKSELVRQLVQLFLREIGYTE